MTGFFITTDMELIEYIEANTETTQEAKISLITTLLIEMGAKFVNYQHKKNFLYIDYDIVDQISWTTQYKIEQFLNCIVKFLDEKTYNEIVLNIRKEIR